MQRKKSSFMIYADSENKENRDEIYTTKYQKNLGWSYGYKLVYVDDQPSKPFKSYLGQ